MSPVEQKIILQSVPSGYKSHGTRVVQVGDFLVASTTFLFKGQNMAIILVGKDTAPSKLMNSSSDIAEQFLNQINDDYQTEGGKRRVLSLFREETQKLATKELREKEGMKKIEANLEESLEMSKQNFNLFIDREKNLNDLEGQSN